MKDTQDFIENHYLDYAHCDEILVDEYLYQLVENDFEPESGAEEYLNEHYGGDIENPQIKIDHLQSKIYVLESAIEGFIKSSNEK